MRDVMERSNANELIHPEVCILKCCILYSYFLHSIRCRTHTERASLPCWGLVFIGNAWHNNCCAFRWYGRRHRETATSYATTYCLPLTEERLQKTASSFAIIFYCMSSVHQLVHCVARMILSSMIAIGSIFLLNTYIDIQCSRSEMSIHFAFVSLVPFILNKQGHLARFLRCLLLIRLLKSIFTATPACAHMFVHRTSSSSWQSRNATAAKFA